MKTYKHSMPLMMNMKPKTAKAFAKMAVSQNDSQQKLHLCSAFEVLRGHPVIL